jgi:hypothetical protein
MKIMIFFASLLVCFTSFGQSFQGTIVYKNSYKSKVPNLNDEKFTAIMGDTQRYYIKGGSYKSVMNGQLVQWQLYSNKDNKLYNKMSNTETLSWNDGGTNPDEVLDAKVNKAATEILGYLCDELILTCKSGIQKYYYSSKFSVDPAVYVRHKFGNWYEFISRSKSLPLKSVIDNAQYTIVTVATSIQETRLDETLFELPANVKTMKSPY